MSNKTFISTSSIAALFAVVMAFSQADAAYVILPNNTRVDGTDIRAKSDGEIILTTPQGQRSFLKGQYLKAVADRPADMDRVKTLYDAKQYDEAIKILQTIVTNYRFLEWDNVARLQIARIQSAKGDVAGAIQSYEDLFRSLPDKKNDPEVRNLYMRALLAAKQYDKLSKELDAVVATGNRAAAAKAQILRGDMKLDQGQVEGALLDYLRTVVLFTSEADSQPEALYKAGTALKTLRDPRSADMFKTLAEKYPDSEYARKAASGT